MSNFNKSFTIAIIATLIVGLPVLLTDLQLTSIQMLIAIFLVSLASSMAAAPIAKKRGKKAQRRESRARE